MNIIRVVKCITIHGPFGCAKYRGTHKNTNTKHINTTIGSLKIHIYIYIFSRCCCNWQMPKGKSEEMRTSDNTNVCITYICRCS